MIFTNNYFFTIFIIFVFTDLDKHFVIDYKKDHFIRQKQCNKRCDYDIKNESY